MIAFVTGASGFIGSHLVESLIQRGFTVRALVRKTRRLRWIQGLKIEWVFGDFCDDDFPQDTLRGVDYVFHLAGVIEASSRKKYFQINHEGTGRLLEACAEACPFLKKFVFVSSQAAGGPSQEGRAVREEDSPHPVSHYGASKLAAEKEVLRFGNRFPTVILRPPTIYGPRDTRVFTAFRMMKQGFALAAGRRSKKISFCYVSDLIEALHLAVFKSESNGRVYNVTGERPYEWLEFVEAISQAMKRPYRLYRIPPSLLFLLGMGGEIYSRLTRRSTMFTRQHVKEFVQNSWVIDGSRIQKELGWQEKVDLQEGMKRTAEWYRKEGWL